jgi:MFS family permease
MDGSTVIRRDYKRWKVVFCGVLIFVCLGTIYSWSIFRHPLEVLFDINATQSGLPYMFFLVCYAAAMPVAGIILQKQKHFKVILIGGFMVASGWIVSSYSPNVVTMVVSLGVVAGSGVGIVYGAVIAAISNWFPDRKGLATGITLSGFGLSSFITAPLSRYMIESFGLMETFRFLGFVFFLVIVLSAMVFRSTPKAMEIQTNINRDGDISAKQMMRKGAFYALWGCFGIGTFNGLMAVSIAGPIGQEIFKLDETFTAIMVSAFAIFNCIGRPLFGWLTDLLKPKKAAQLLFAIIFAASTIMLVAGTKTALYVMTFALLWLALGGWLAVAPAASAIMFGSRNHAKNYGIIFTAYGVGAVIGVLVSGSIRDTTGSYHMVFYPMMISAVLGLILSTYIRKRN